jgi:hypothetical protein
MGSPDWAPGCYTDWPDFRAAVHAAEPSYVFIDECLTLSKTRGPDLEAFAVAGRHMGHRFCFISQRYVGLIPTIRDQCKMLACFAISNRDAKILSEDWNDDAILKAHNFQLGEYLWKRRLQPATHNKPRIKDQ